MKLKFIPSSAMPLGIQERKNPDWRMRMTSHGLLFSTMLVLAIGHPLKAGEISSQAALETVLGGVGTLETFQGFSVASGNAASIGCATLNSSAICSGQGPGLVVPGIDITFGSGGGQWDGANYYGSTSEEILSGSPAGQPLAVTFTTSVSAFGVDLRAFAGFPATATVTILGLDDTTVIGTISGVSLGTDGIPVFVGWEDTSGIGEVEFTQSGQAWSPIIDNLQFGTAVPEPASSVLFGVGLTLIAALRQRLNRRRSGGGACQQECN